ncbi:MAG: hypothetical protein HY941_08735 [Gammaproteobacteria bacterium]|nr:hypothetical protein [Gammaproteobacteria bacterium]
MSNNKFAGPSVRGWIQRLVFLLTVACLLPAWAADTRIVDQVEIDTSGERPRITINFNVPLQYISHAPSTHGDKIVVQLRPLVNSQTADIDFTHPETLNWQATPGVPLQQMRYEGGTNQSVQIGVYFRKAIDFEVQPSPDARSLSILLPKAELPAHAPGAPTAEPTPGISKPQADIIPTLPALPAERLDALIEEARQAMAAGNYPQAIQIYTKILQHQDTGKHQDALEFLGLARERNGQAAHAKMEYERYLQRYPEGDSAERVRQRLSGLVTARQAPQGKLREAGAEAGAEESAWEYSGNFSQFYRRDTSHIVEEENVTNTRTSETRVNLSSLSNDLDFNARRRGPLAVQTRFTGGYEYDFLDAGEGQGDISRVSSLYADFQDSKHDVGARVGRQTRSTGGVLGRFDGALLSYQFKPTVKLNAVSGYPVDSSKNNLKTDRYFYGVSADFGTYANAWDFVAFIIEQQVDSILDRRSVGGEARYFDPVKSLLSYVDYDVSYSQLNTLLLLGNWNLPKQITLNATVDIRESPILTTYNAIQGQGVDSIDALRQRFSVDTIRQLAEDRTASSHSYTVGATKQLNDSFQLTGDVTLSELGSTPASGGVEAMPSTGDEYYYNAQLIGSNLLKEGDITLLGLRYSDASTSDTTSLTLNERYPINTAWRVNPRMRVDYRVNKPGDTDQWIYAPSILVDYLWRKRYRFELETGGEWSARQLSDATEDTKSYFVYVGYRADF